MKFYEVLKILETSECDDEIVVEDMDSMGEIECDDDEDSIVEALSDFGLELDVDVDIYVDTDCGIVAIYSPNGEYIYQLRAE